MNYSVLIPLLMPITVAIVLPILSSLGKRSEQEVAGNVCGYSLGLQVFIWIGAFLFALMPLGFEAFGVTLKFWDLVATLMFVVILVVGAIYTKKYNVVLGGESFFYGAFLQREVKYDRIRSAERKTSGRGSVFLVVKYEDKGRLAFSGSLQDFDDLVKKVKQKIRH